MNKIKVLCTGSGGGIINNLIRNSIFEKRQYDFVSIDKITKSSVLNNIYSNKNHTFYIGDIADDHFVNVIFEIEKPDIVIHGASEKSNPNNFIHSNILGTQVLVNAAIKWNTKKFIHLSTYKVYGELGDKKDLSWVKTEGFPFREDAILNPSTQYAASKAAAEYIVKAASKSNGLNYIITRAANNYGQRQGKEKLIPKTIKSILDNQKIQIYGNGMNTRDWLHTFDYSSALVKILECGKMGETYNISSHQEFSNLEVVNEVCNTIGKGHNLIEFVADKVPHDFRMAADATKLRALGWAPDYKFKNAIKQTCEWFVNNSYCLK